ncbi:glutathione S-transferase family protein [Acinetobacter qingfengensis]|uniref:Glutathione S-transferase n=1 Tax=Acinetobacter qingfengensis TaxID=1262585 RepID=A0A1E7R3Z1_9GAMM|nr:glutathione S-transferase family protein [Acinetobacter qingfengensis]KAA8733743.1 glutathione S-transferase family protein [Acinetobacter qingfengensis]OEY94035.1 glutathione S-transferase [Acinetobacter qingfengensis]
MSITIWGRPNSLNVHKVLWLAAELELEFKHIPAGQHYGLLDTEEFYQVNPNRLVPVLQDGDTVIWESNTILRYLAEVYGKDTLWITDPKARFAAEKWIDWYTTTVLPSFGVVFFNLIRQPEDKRDLDAVKNAAEKLEKILDVAELELSKQPYLSGQDFSIGDIPLALALNHWFNLDIERHHQHTYLQAWIERIRQRPHFLKIANVL